MSGQLLQARNYRGFTLIEVIVTLCIVALLMTTVLPAYQRQLLGVRRSLARVELLKLASRQEQFFLHHRRYAEALTDLGLPDNPYAINSQGDAVAALDESRIYVVSLVTRGDGYTLTASPQLNQARDASCGALSLDSSGRRQAVGGASCW